MIGVGGGSPLDTVKAVAMMSVCEGEITDYMGVNVEAELPPMAAIPTTAGTGSETTQFTIITDTKSGVKMLLKGSSLLPDLAIVDPALTVSSPASVTVATGLDALTHSIESYTSRKAQPLSDTLALSAIRRIFRYLPDAVSDGGDLKAREEMAVAALEAGMSFNNSSVTLVHGMSRPIGALFHVPHGISNAMLLGVCLNWAKDGARERFAAMARLIGAASDTDSEADEAQLFVDAVIRLCRDLKVPTLEEYGIPKDAFMAQIDKMAADAMASGSPSNTRREISAEDIKKLYLELWK